MSQLIKVGHMEIRYLVDGAHSGGLGLFEMKVLPVPACPHRTGIPTTKNAFTCWKASFDIRSMTKRATCSRVNGCRRLRVASTSSAIPVWKPRALS